MAAPLATSTSTDNTATKSAPRLENTIACVPIVYGSIAFALHTNKKQAATADATHSWTLYLRGPNNEDLSKCIDKAVFHLHPSFAKPVRELTSTPYEVTERGWGEFEAQIRIHWKDPNEKPTVVNHLIKLYPPPPEPNTPAASKSNKSSSSGDGGDPNAPVVAETYDEVVFTNPTETFFDQLRQVPKASSVEYSHQEHFGRFSDADDFLSLVEAQKFIRHELEAMKERMDVVNREMDETDNALRDAQEKAKAAAASQRRSAKQQQAQQAQQQAQAAGRTNAPTTTTTTATPASKKAKTAAGSVTKK